MVQEEQVIKTYLHIPGIQTVWMSRAEHFARGQQIFSQN